MPATRRSRGSNGPAAKGAQSTLSFGSRSRVTKPVAPSSKLSKDATESIKANFRTPEAELESVEITPSEVETPESGHTTTEVGVEKQEKIESSKIEVEKSQEVREAESISNTQVKRYWKTKEAERNTQRVHQEGLSVEEKILRLFDMSSQYGPCIGIARMKRWSRAHKLGLNPPIEVLAVMVKEEKKGNSKIERAHVDELMTSNLVV